MCTATWLIRPDGFELFFNRDESVRRGVALEPREAELGGVRALFARDSDAGGTWLGVNERGLAVGLLNGADLRGSADAPRRSRGLLVTDLLATTSMREALSRLDGTALERYRGFVLFLIAPGAEPAARIWDGARLARTAPRAPLSSSSLDRERAQAERDRLYARTVAGEPTRTSLAEFQRSHEPERGPWSPCMHRADASTVSASEVRVDARAVALRYAPGPPCSAEFGPWLELAR